MLPHDDYSIDILNTNPPISPSQQREEGRLMTFEDVEERLIQAMCCAWRQPDREKGWLTVRASWPDVWRHNHFGDYSDDDPDARLRPAPLTRREIAQMDEAFGWLDDCAAEDRKLISLAISRLARGEKQVPWMKLKRAMGVKFGADGLRKRYSRALSKVCNAVNRRIARDAAVKGQ